MQFRVVRCCLLFLFVLFGSTSLFSQTPVSDPQAVAFALRSNRSSDRRYDRQCDSNPVRDVDCRFGHGEKTALLAFFAHRTA